MVGLGVAAVALIALQRPGGRQASSETGPVTASAPASAARSARPSSARPRTTPAHITPPAPAHATPPAPALASPLPLIVLNNTASAGAQNVAEQEFEKGGWSVSYVSTLDNQILSTCVYYDPGILTRLLRLGVCNSSSQLSSALCHGSPSCRPDRSSSCSRPISPADRARPVL